MQQSVPPAREYKIAKSIIIGEREIEGSDDEKLIKRHILWYHGNYFLMLATNTSRKNIPQRKPLTSIFFKPRFSYCPLVAMCSSHSVNQEINRLNKLDMLE